MASSAVEAPPMEAPTALVPRHSLRLSGTAHAPLLRGYLHLVAFVAAFPAAVALMRHSPTAPTSVYALALIVMYGISAAYHRLPLEPARRRQLRQADHAMIYLFTAACYTPFCLLAVGGTLGVVVLALAWLGAVAGVALKVVGFGRRPVTGSVLYLVLGFLAAVTLPGSARLLGPVELGLILGTGFVYVIGAVILFTRRPDPVPHLFGYHEVWHGCVVIASGLYFAVVWKMAGIAP